MNPWSNPEVADVLDEILHNPENDFETVKARIPSLWGTSLKATYLALRSLGLTPQQALEGMDYSEDLLNHWKETDPKFIDWERANIRSLQTTLSADLVRIGFMKNMALLVSKDTQIIMKSMLLGNEMLSKRDFDYLMKVRGHYTTADLLSLDKVLHPGKHNEEIKIVLNWGDQQEVIEGVQAPYQIEEANPNDYDDQQYINHEVDLSPIRV